MTRSARDFSGARPFHRQQDRAAPFATDANPLNEAQDDHQDRTPDADLLIGRNASHQKGRQAGQQQGDDQRRLAADPIAVMSEDRRPDWSCAKPTAKTANASKVPVSGSDFGKYNFPKTSAAIWPYTRKSYHSIVVPTVLAMTARRSRPRCSRSVSGTAAMSAVAIDDPPVLGGRLKPGTYYCCEPTITLPA